MAAPSTSTASLRERMRAREALLGTFQKIAHYHATELLAAGRLDYIVIDAEHAVFTRRELDACLLAARAAGIAALVRLPDSSPSGILAALDMGAAGVVVPRVSSAAAARKIVAAAHYAAHDGLRGFSNSPRAGGYGRSSMRDHVMQSDQSVVVICQIEDVDAVEAIDDIAAVEGVHGLLVGPADLSLSYQCESPADPVVAAAIQRVARAARDHGVAAGIALAGLDQAAPLARDGFSFFIAGTDQSLLARGALALAAHFQESVVSVGKEES
ncbi:MAG: aldolase/citrate lyase family protein [Candidimonas sp.]